MWQAVLTQAFGGYDAAVPAMQRFFAVGRRPADAGDRLLGREGSFAGRHRLGIEAIERLCPALAAVTGSRIIVDSSKFPPYGVALALALA